MRSLILVPARLFAALVCLLSSSVYAQDASGCAPAPGYREVALLGEQRDALAGQTVVALGDINGDGMEDYAVAAPNYSVPGLIWAGVIYVIYGSPHQAPTSLGVFGPSPALSPAQGFVIVGDQEGSGTSNWQHGGSIQAMGDLDGDGIDDFAVGQRTTLSADGELEGAVYFFYGKRATGSSTSFPPHIKLSDVAAET